MSADTTPATDRRAAPRFQANSGFSFHRERRWQRGALHDISTGGAQIIAPQPLLPGHRTSLVLENVADSENIIVHGVVKWQRTDTAAAGLHSNAFRMGIEFYDALPVSPECFIKPVRRKML